MFVYVRQKSLRKTVNLEKYPILRYIFIVLDTIGYVY